MLQYPWLYLAYHRTRLVRNYVIHGDTTRNALLAWNSLCTRALGGERSAYAPAMPEEWRAIRVALLRMLYAAMRNAIDLTGKQG